MYASRIDAARQLKLISGDTAILSGNTYIMGGFTGGTDSQFFGTVKGFDAILPNEFITYSQFTGSTGGNNFIENQDVSGQTANFNITGTGVIGSALTLNSGFPGYQTVITSKHDNSDTFEVQQNNGTVLKYYNPNFSAIGGFETLQLGNGGTHINNLFGSFTLSGNSGSVGGIGRGGYLNNTLYSGANDDILIGLDITPQLLNGTPITALDNSSLLNGSGYTNGIYTVNFSNLSGHYGAIGNIMVSGNIVTGVTLTYGGFNYQVGDVLTALFGGGTGFSINVLTVSSYTGITSIGLRVGGGIQASGLTTGTVVNYLGLDSGNNFVLDSLTNYLKLNVSGQTVTEGLTIDGTLNALNNVNLGNTNVSGLLALTNITINGGLLYGSYDGGSFGAVTQAQYVFYNSQDGGFLGIGDVANEPGNGYLASFKSSLNLGIQLPYMNASQLSSLMTTYSAGTGFISTVAYQTDTGTQGSGLYINNGTNWNRFLTTQDNNTFIPVSGAGQTTLVLGTKTITISGLTSSSKATIGFISIGGTVTTTWQYKAACSTNTLTITAITTTGTTNTSDTSTLSYITVT